MGGSLPDMVKRALPFAGTAKTTPHDYIFARSHEDALKSDPAWNGGFYNHQSDVHAGLRRHAQIPWSVMGLCPDFYNQEAWRGLGFTSLEDFLRRFWEAYFAPMDPNNLIWMGWKWRHGDVSRHTGGDLKAALGRIKAKTYVVPFSRDMFFPPADCEAEQKLIPNSTFRIVDSLLAHFAMFCLTRSDRDQIDFCIDDLLAEKVRLSCRTATAEGDQNRSARLARRISLLRGVHGVATVDPATSAGTSHDPGLKTPVMGGRGPRSRCARARA